MQSEQTLPALQEQAYVQLGSDIYVRARTDFVTFISIFRPPGSSFIFSRLHQLLADLVQGVADGEKSPRRCVSVPPQNGKSEVTAKLAAAWLMGAFPGLSVAYTSHSNDLCVEVSDAVRDIVNSPHYAAIFPAAKIIYGSNRKDSWKLTTGSHFRAKPAGSKFTGRRIDWMIVDDPHKGREESESKVQREKVIKWYFADLTTRLSPGAVVFVVQTRWHPEDLVGILSNEERAKQLQEADASDELFSCTTISAICEKEENDPLGRKVGESCFPELRGAKFFHNIKQSLPSYDWDSQYQQRPRLTGSGNIDFSLLQYISWEELPQNLELVRHWDLAVSEEQASDYTAGALVAYDEVEDKIYIAHMVRARQNWIAMRKGIVERALKELEDYGVARLGIEAVAGFIAAYQDLRNLLLGKVRVQPTKPTKSKLSRATPWLNKIEAKRVFIVRGAWNKDFIDELEQFPAGTHDDQVDAVSGGWELLAGRKRFTTAPTPPKETEADPAQPTKTGEVKALAGTAARLGGNRVISPSRRRGNAV